jgi:NitT/TauT family transport system substrate-binding protein
MAVMDGCDHILVTSPNVKRVEDLKGKIIGISSFGGTPHSEALTILRKYGLNPEKDVTFMQIGGSSTRYAALESGAIHAAMLIPPFNKIGRKKGFNELLSFNDVMKIPCAGVAVHLDKIKERPDETVKIIKATLKSMEFIRSRKDEITSHMEKKWGIKDGDVREGIYGDIVGLYSRTGIASEEGMKNVLQMVQEARKMKGTASPADITEWSYARRANDELKGR